MAMSKEQYFEMVRGFLQSRGSAPSLSDVPLPRGHAAAPAPIIVQAPAPVIVQTPVPAPVPAPGRRREEEEAERQRSTVEKLTYGALAVSALSALSFVFYQGSASLDEITRMRKQTRQMRERLPLAPEGEEAQMLQLCLAVEELLRLLENARKQAHYSKLLTLSALSTGLVSAVWMTSVLERVPGQAAMLGTAGGVLWGVSNWSRAHFFDKPREQALRARIEQHLHALCPPPQVAYAPPKAPSAPVE